MKRRTLASIATGVVVALLAGLFCLTPIANRIENQYGLGLLYLLRGTVQPPPGALIVALDRQTLEWLREGDGDPARERLLTCLPQSARAELQQIRGPGSLPRSVHGCLINELKAIGIPVVAFDILFSVQGDPEDDRAFADALRGHGATTILVGFERSVVQDGPSELLVEREVQPYELFRTSATSTAAFIVPRSGGPVYGYLSQLPMFQGTRSLPEAALALWQQKQPGVDTNPVEARPFEYFWLYGSPGSIETVSAHEILAGEVTEDVRARAAESAAFIGASDPATTNYPDAFPSFFRGGSDADISGVELAATAFLNLKSGERLVRVSPAIALTLTILFAGVLGFFAKARSGFAMVATPIAAIALLAAATTAFAKWRLFFPLGTPLFVAAPVIFLLAVVIRYRFARALIMHLAPAPVARRMLAKTSDDRGSAVSDEATVVFFDLVGSTAIAEKIPAVDFSMLLNSYHETITRGVGKERGFVSGFSGDGVLAVFNRSDAGPDHAARACRSVISVIRGIKGVNESNEQRALPELKLRVGLNSGSVAEGDIGASDRFNFSVVGDVVNLAARLEQLGKILFPGESNVILAGQATYLMARNAGLAFRDCGMSAIPGRERGENVYRLLD